MKYFLTALVALPLLFIACPSTQPQPTPAPPVYNCDAVHVKAGAVGGDGKSWATAFGNLQQALDAAKIKSAKGKVLVALAEGEYRADATQKTAVKDPSGSTQQLVEAVAKVTELRDVEIRGGFEAVGDCATQPKPDLEAKTILSGKYLDNLTEKRVLHVLRFDSQLSQMSNLVLSGFVIRDGRTFIANQAPDTLNYQNAGAGLLLVGVKGVHIERVAFLENAASHGAGLAMANAVADLKSTRFEKNTVSQMGGAIRADGTLTVVDSIFDDNKADSGGAIDGMNADVTISGSTFSNNKATQDGGALFGFTRKVKATASTFSNNQATNLGGAIAIRQTVPPKPQTFFEIDSNCIFEDNQARSGGAIALASYTWVDAKNSIFRRNIATAAGGPGSQRTGGGALFLGQFAQVKLDQAVFEENKALWGGAVLAVDTTYLTISGGRFLRNEADQNAGGGGAIRFFEGASLAIDNTTSFEENTALSGGAINISALTITPTLTIRNARFIENKANPANNKGTGGAIVSNAVQFSVENVLFEKNEAFIGGAILQSLADLAVRDCDFLENKADLATGSGGAIVFVSGAGNNLDITQNSTFEDNSASAGGAISGLGGNVRIQDSAFRRNSAATVGGGISNQFTATIENTEFTSNIAPSGSAIENGNLGNLTLRNQDNGKFTLNSTPGNTGFNGVDNKGGTFNQVP